MSTEQEQVRRAKLDQIVQAEIHPNPERYPVTHELTDAGQLADGVTHVRVAGRIMAVRKMGKLTFLTIQDIHARLQLCLKQDHVGEKAYAFFSFFGGYWGFPRSRG